jgi:hypothetical protein
MHRNHIHCPAMHVSCVDLQEIFEAIWESVNLKVINKPTVVVVKKIHTSVKSHKRASKSRLVFRTENEMWNRGMVMARLVAAAQRLTYSQICLAINRYRIEYLTKKLNRAWITMSGY